MKRRLVLPVRTGPGMRSFHMSGGRGHRSWTILSAHGVVDEWKHPWWLDFAWESDLLAPEGEWRAYVTPGFVNGVDVAIEMSAGLADVAAEQGDREWHINPLTGKPFFSDDIFKRTRDAEIERKSEAMQLLLTDEPRPYLRLTGWRDPAASLGMAVSGEELVALPAEGYPEIFGTMGAKRPDAGSRSAEPAFADEIGEVTRDREIRACDVVLTTPRIATVQSVTLQGTAFGENQVSYDSTFNASYYNSIKNDPRTRSLYRLRTQPRWVPPPEPTIVDKLMGTSVEPQTDELLMATVYALSSPGMAGEIEAQPEPAWELYGRYSDAGFWNLNHARVRPLPETPFEPITFNYPLAAGAVNAVINAILSPINDGAALIHAALTETSYRGLYWTA